MKVIVGLGNPGLGYARTRHNIGFKAVDEFVKEKCGSKHVKKTTDYTLIKTVCGGEPVAVVKPMMFMNLSGQAVSRTPYNFRGENDVMIVVFDDASLDVGKIRFRADGRSGGHKGMQNIIDVFGTTDIHRLRIGVGKDPDMMLTDYVLRPFTPEQKQLLPDVIARAAEALEFYLENGITVAMNKYNGGAKSE